MSRIALQPVLEPLANFRLKEDQQYKVTALLSDFMATSYILYLKTLHCHRNVEGLHVTSLRFLLEQQYKDLHNAGYTLAERIRALGQQTFGTFREFAEKSAVKKDTDVSSNTDEIVRNLLRDHEICAKEARKLLRLAEIAGDEVTCDIAITRMTAHEKAAWMLHTLIQ